MRIKGAMTILNKERKFLGMTMEELIDFIDTNPMAVSHKTLEAYEVYQVDKGLVWCGLNGVKWTTPEQSAIEGKIYRGEGHQLDLFKESII